MTIQQLPDHVVAQIRSSNAITSLNGVIVGLIKNALDAEATRVNISVDYTRGNCTVEDDGGGILPVEFADTGHLGRLHCTSKFPARSDIPAHGSTGTFLASVAALSLLSITSHHRNHRSHNTIKIHNSKVLARHLPSPPDQTLLTFSHGTRAVIRDLFGSMPVRVKQRPIALNRTAISREWNHLKLAITALLLAWPGHVTINIRDSAAQQSLILRNSGSTSSASAERARRSDVVMRVGSLLLQADLSEDSSLKTWVSLKASASHLSIHGAICLTPVATKQIQFISLGIHPLSNENGFNAIYEEINRLFSNSSFGVEEEGVEIDQAERFRRAQDGRFKNDGYTDRELKAKRGVDKWPMFYINVGLIEECRDVENILDERCPILQNIIDIVSMTVSEFLKKHNLRPRHYRARTDKPIKQQTTLGLAIKSASRDNSPVVSSKSMRSRSTSKAVDKTNWATKTSRGDLATTQLCLATNNERRPRPDSPFSLWARTRSAHPTSTIPKEARTEKSSHHWDKDIVRSVSNPSDKSLLDTSGNLLQVPFPDTFPPRAVDTNWPSGDSGGASGSASNQETEDIVWNNPLTGKTCAIDPRTGFTLPSPNGPQKTTSRLTRPIHSTRPQSAEVKDGKSNEVNEILSAWKNPVFETAEPAIPRAFDETRFLDSMTEASSGRCGGFHHVATANGTEPALSIYEKISRNDLRDAEVVAQVDQKFILIKLPARTQQERHVKGHEKAGSLLVLIDQHAADERYRVEMLIREYFAWDITSIGKTMKARTELLEQALSFEVSVQECSLFEKHLSHFEHWGVLYQTSLAVKNPFGETDKSKKASSVRVTSLPTSIVERSRLQPRLLIDLMRTEIWRLDEHGPSKVVPQKRPQPSQQIDEDLDASSLTELHWLAGFHGCPQGILDMINSRACRSAIMFNDFLSLQECQDLIRRLADCAFPFQCAHGRPSMVPLVDLGERGLGTEEVERNECGLASDLRRWMDRLGSDGG